MSSETGRGIIKAGNALRFLYRYGVNGPAILQQAWSDVDTGEIHWRDVPYVTVPAEVSTADVRPIEESARIMSEAMSLGLKHD